MKTFHIYFLMALTLCSLGFSNEKEKQENTGLSVTLKLPPKENGVQKLSPSVVRFTNTSNKPIQILRPLDGSLWGWHMPHYKLDIVGQDGKSLPLGPRCGVSGLWAHMKWPKEYIITMKPGESVDQEIWSHHMIPEDGTYTVTFSYTYKSGTTSLNPEKYPDGLWEGEAKSKSVNVDLEK